jgi:hypothetical protein
VGVETLVMLSVFEVPLSEMADKSGTLGVLGAVESITIAIPAEAPLVLPAVSVALLVSVWEPSDRALVVTLQMPPVAMAVPNTVVPSVSYTVTTEPDSAVPVKVGVETLVMLSVFEVPLSEMADRSGVLGALGAVESITIAIPAEALLVLPAVSVALLVSVWEPSDRALVVTLQLPSPSAVAVPSTVVPSVSYAVTSEFDSAVPVRVGVESLVMLSELEVPLSEMADKSGTLGVLGAVESITISRPAEALLILPVASAALLVSVWEPSDKTLVVTLQLPAPSAVAVPSTVEPSVSYTVTSEFDSAVPVRVGVESLVMLSELEVPLSEAAERYGLLGALGGVVSTDVAVMPLPVRSATTMEASAPCAQSSLAPRL